MGMYDWEEYHNYNEEYADAIQEGVGQVIPCECQVVHETGKAYLLHITKLNKECWFPKSQVKLLSLRLCEIPTWLIRKNI